MRKMMFLAVMVAMAALMLAASPAMADDDFNRDFDFDDGGFTQDTEQEAESGDLDQSIDISGGGDNSNQCVGTQLVGNTGNAQNSIDVVDAGDFNGDFNGRLDDDDFFDDDDDNDFFFDGDGNGGNFELDEVESSIEVSPTNTTSCDSQVNQAASASG